MFWNIRFLTQFHFSAATVMVMGLFALNMHQMLPIMHLTFAHVIQEHLRKDHRSAARLFLIL